MFLLMFMLLWGTNHADPDPYQSSVQGYPLYEVSTSEEEKDPMLQRLVQIGGTNDNNTTILSTYHSWFIPEPSIHSWSFTSNKSNMNWPFKVLTPKVDYWSPSSFPVPLHWRKINDFILPSLTSTTTLPRYVDSTIPASLPYSLPPPPLTVTGLPSVIRPGWIEGSCSLPSSLYEASLSPSSSIDTVGVHVWLTNLGSPELPWSREYFAYPFDVWLTIPTVDDGTRGRTRSPTTAVPYNFSFPLIDLNFYANEQFTYSEPPPFTTQPGVPWTKDAILRENIEASAVHYFPSRFPFHRQRLPSQHPYRRNPSSSLPYIDLFMNGTAQWFLLCNSFVVYTNGTRRVSEYILMDNFNPYTSTTDHQGVWSRDENQRTFWSHQLNGLSPVGWWGTQLAFSPANHSLMGCLRFVPHAGFTNPTPSSYGQCWFRPEINVRYSSTAVGFGTGTDNQLVPYFYLPFTVTMADWHLDDNYYATSASVKYACADYWLDGYVNGVSGGCPLYAQGNGWFLTWGTWQYGILNRNMGRDSAQNISYGTTIMHNPIISPGMMWLPGLYSHGSKYNRYLFPTMHRRDNLGTVQGMLRKNVPDVFLHRIRTVAHTTSVSGKDRVYPDWFSAWAWVIGEREEVDRGRNHRKLPLPYRIMDGTHGTRDVPVPNSLIILNAPGDNQGQITDILVKCTVPSARSIMDRTVVRIGAHIWLARTDQSKLVSWMGEIWSFSPIDDPFQTVHYGIITLADLRNYQGNFSYERYNWRVSCQTILYAADGTYRLSEPRYQDDPSDDASGNDERESMEAMFSSFYLRSIMATENFFRLGREFIFTNEEVNGTIGKYVLNYRTYAIDPPTNVSFEITERNITLHECSSKVIFRLNMPRYWRSVWITEVVVESLSAYEGFTRPWVYVLPDLPTPEIEEFIEFSVNDSRSFCGVPLIYRLYLRGYWPQGNSLWNSTKYSDIVLVSSNKTNDLLVTPPLNISKWTMDTTYTGVPISLGNGIDLVTLRDLSRDYSIGISVSFTDFERTMLLVNSFAEEYGIYVYNISTYYDLINVPLDVFEGIWILPTEIRTVPVQYRIQLTSNRSNFIASYIVKQVYNVLGSPCNNETVVTITDTGFSCSNIPPCENRSIAASSINLRSISSTNVTSFEPGLYTFDPVQGLDRACKNCNNSCPINWESSCQYQGTIKYTCVPTDRYRGCLVIQYDNSSLQCVQSSHIDSSELLASKSLNNTISVSNTLVNRSNNGLTCDPFGVEWCRAGFCSCYSSFLGSSCDECIDGFWGSACNLPCLCPIANANVCNRWTGQCLACKTGTFGITCGDSVISTLPSERAINNHLPLVSNHQLLYATTEVKLSKEVNVTISKQPSNILISDMNDIVVVNFTAVQLTDGSYLPYWMCGIVESVNNVLLSSLVPERANEIAYLTSARSRFLVPISLTYNTSKGRASTISSIVPFTSSPTLSFPSPSSFVLEFRVDHASYQYTAQRDIHFLAPDVTNVILYMNPSLQCSSIFHGIMTWEPYYSRRGIEAITFNRNTNHLPDSNITCNVSFSYGYDVVFTLLVKFIVPSNSFNRFSFSVRVPYDQSKRMILPLPRAFVNEDQSVSNLQHNCPYPLSVYRDTITNDVFLSPRSLPIPNNTLCTLSINENATYTAAFIHSSIVSDDTRIVDPIVYGTITPLLPFFFNFPFNLSVTLPSTTILLRDMATNFSSLELVLPFPSYQHYPSTGTPLPSNSSYIVTDLGNNTFILPSVPIYGTHIVTLSAPLSYQSEPFLGIFEFDSPFDRMVSILPNSPFVCPPPYSGPLCTECASENILVIDTNGITCVSSSSVSAGLYTLRHQFLPDTKLRQILSVLTVHSILERTSSMNDSWISSNTVNGSLYQSPATSYLIIVTCSVTVFIIVFIVSFRRILRSQSILFGSPIPESLSSTSILSSLHPPPTDEDTIHYYENQYYNHNNNSISKSSFSTRINPSKMKHQLLNRTASTDKYTGSTDPDRVAFPPVSNMVNSASLSTYTSSVSTLSSKNISVPPTLKNILSLWRIHKVPLSDDLKEERIQQKDSDRSNYLSSRTKSNANIPVPSLSSDHSARNVHHPVGTTTTSGLSSTMDNLLAGISTPSITAYEENVIHLPKVHRKDVAHTIQENTAEEAPVLRATLPFRSSPPNDSTKTYLHPQTVRKPPGLKKLRIRQPPSSFSSISSSSSSSTVVEGSSSSSISM